MIANEHKNILEQLIPDNFSRYTKTVNADRETLSAINIFQSDPNFRILKITTDSHQKVESFIQSEDFCEAFKSASHWFLIVVQITENSQPDPLLLSSIRLTKHKPVILQWHSSSAKRLYYRNSGKDDFIDCDLQSLPTLSHEELSEKLSNEGHFTFQVLLQALKANLGGQLSDNLLTATLETATEFDGWRLIDYATLYGDSLSLRWLFLSMTNEDLAKKNSEGSRTLEIAAQYANPDCISALLNLPFPATVTEEWFLSSSSRDLLEQKDDAGNTPLLIAAKHGKIDNLQLLMDQGADIGNAITCSYENNQYNAVKKLLEADSPFPQGFQEQDIKDSELKEFVLERNNFHQALIEGNITIDYVTRFIEKYPRLKHVYNTKNDSALTSALKAQQYEMYALLQSKGYAIGRKEKQYPEEQLTGEQKQRLKKAKEHYFGKSEQSHIIYLLSKSRLGLGQTDNKAFDKIKRLYEALDNIPEISTILKVVEQVESLEIIFDFNHDSIIDIDPTQSAATAGACDYRRGRIYIGAKQNNDNDTDLLGTLAHELSHLAMQIRYNNHCNPYETLEETKEASFEKIIKEYQNNTAVDDIIKRVFSVYPCPNDWPSELIVRVPHLLAKYSNQHVLQEQASSLLTWYRNQISSDLTSFITSPKIYKTQNKIQDLNQQFEQLDRLKELSKFIQLTEKRLLRDAAIDGQKMTILYTSSPQFTLLNLYQKLASRLTPNQLVRNLLVVQPAHIKNPLTTTTISDALHENPDLLLIIDNITASNEAEQKDLLSDLRYIKAQIQKVVLIVPIANTIQQWQEFSPRKIADSGYNWQNLITASQLYILQKEVNFQGYTVKLKELINSNSNSQVAEMLPLEKLLTSEETLKIGEDVPSSYGYDPDFYIDRNFNHQVTIKEALFRDQEFTDLIAKSQEEFSKLCEQNPNENIHWLQQESGRWIWKKSQGNLKKLREYIDISHINHYTQENVQHFLDQAKNDQVMLIADTAGMGKTTILTHLSKKIKQEHKDYWVTRIDLNDYTDILDQYEGDSFTPTSATEFVMHSLLKLKQEGLEIPLFEHLLEEKKIVLMFDGFDEVSPTYKDIVVTLLKNLKDTRIKQLWITTRPHLKNDLEDNLSQISYTLNPFSQDNQVEFITKFWKKLIIKSEKFEESRINTYATALVKSLSKSINDKNKEFLGIPLQTKMLAEAFDQEFKAYYYSENKEHDIPDKLNLLNLYDKFLNRKYLIYVSEKNNPLVVNVATKDLIDILKGGVNLRKTHQQLAIQVLFPKQEKMLLDSKKSRNLPEEKLSRIGITQMHVKRTFIHRTFAEYFVADFLIEELKKEKSSVSSLDEFQEFLLKDIFLLNDYQVIRSFFNEFLKEAELTGNTLEEYGKKISKLGNLLDQPHKNYGITLYDDTDLIALNRDRELYKQENPCHSNDQTSPTKYIMSVDGLKKEESNIAKEWTSFTVTGSGGTILHQSNQEGNFYITYFVLDALEDEKYKNDLKILLLKKDDNGRTIWYGAALKGDDEMLSKLWSVAEKIVLNTEEKKALLLAQDNDGRTSWHWAAKSGNLEVLDKLWGWAKEIGLNNLFSLEDKYKRVAWCWAVQYGNTEVLNKLWSLYKEKNAEEDLFLHKDDYGNIWYWAAQNNVKVLEILLQWREHSRSVSVEELLPAWHGSAENGNMEMLEKLKERIPNTYHFRGDIEGKNRNVWIKAARNNRIAVLDKLLEWNSQNKSDLLLSKDRAGRTAFDIAVEYNYEELFKHQWEWAIREGIDRALFIETKDIYGATAWFTSVWMGHMRLIEKIWEKFEDETDKKRLLRDEKSKRHTIWYGAANSNKTEVLKKLLEWAEIYIPEDLKNVLLLENDYANLPSPWEAAVLRENIDMLDTLWECTTKIVGDERKDLKKPLIKISNDKQSIWHKIFSRGKKTQMLERLICFSKEASLTSEEFKTIFLSKDNDTRTPLDVLFKNYVKTDQRLPIIKLIQEYYSEINNKSLKGLLEEITYFSIASNNYTMAKDCINNKEINLLYKRNGSTLLHQAIRSTQRKRLVKLILDKLKNEKILHNVINIVNNQGDTPLTLAIKVWNENKDENIIKDILQNGATIDSLNMEQCGLLEEYIKKNSTDINNKAQLLQQIEQKLSLSSIREEPLPLEQQCLEEECRFDATTSTAQIDHRINNVLAPNDIEHGNQCIDKSKNKDAIALLNSHLEESKSTDASVTTKKAIIDDKKFGKSTGQGVTNLEDAVRDKNYSYWLSDHDIRRVAHLAYSNMFDVHAMNVGYDTSSRGLVVVTDPEHTTNTKELNVQINQFINNINNKAIVLQQGIQNTTRTFILNQGGNHWTTLVIAYVHNKYLGYYQDSRGVQIPNNIRQILQQNNRINTVDLQTDQQKDGYNCGFWALENAIDIKTMLQENKDLSWLVERLKDNRNRDNQYFIAKRREFEQRLNFVTNQDTISTSDSIDSKPNVDLLNQSICTMPSTDQFDATTSTAQMDPTINNLLAPNTIEDGSQYRQCGSL